MNCKDIIIQSNCFEGVTFMFRRIKDKAHECMLLDISVESIIASCINLFEE